MKSLFSILLILNATVLFSQTQQFKGVWTKINTTYQFEFDLILKTNSSNQVEGYFNWKAVNYDHHNEASRKYYEKKIGQMAKEYVKGTYNQATGEYNLKGYKKEDPAAIIGIDTYLLKIDENGDIGGTTNANGSWLGRINGKQIKMNLL